MVSRAPALLARSGRVALFVLALILAGAATVSAGELRSIRSEHYEIQTDLPRREARVFAKHMDRVFEQYDKRFRDAGLKRQRQERMNLYLFHRQSRFEQFMVQRGVPAQNSGGMFFVLPHYNDQGLATFTEGRSVTETFSVLQHEGFHQFAWEYIGHDLPVWVNEGLAQYFEDGILVRGEMVLNIAHGRRIEAVRRAIRQRRVLPFAEMVGMSSEQWGEILRSRPDQAALLYEQAWSMVFFLITSDEEYRQALEGYLVNVAAGADPLRGFEAAFRLSRGDFDPFQRAWERWAMRVQPNPIAQIQERLTFLGEAMRYARQNRRYRPPKSTAMLRSQLRAINLTITRSDGHGNRRVLKATDETMYQYELDGDMRMFKMFDPDDGLPPRLTAPGLKPQPVLEWRRDHEGDLDYEIIYR